MTETLDIERLWRDAKPTDDGLLPCVVQDVRSRAVLMVAWVSKEALARAVGTGYATYWSRSRNEVWEKGATSGNRQRLLQVRIDCDKDTILYLVDPAGPACHEGNDTCFSRRRIGNGWAWEPEQVLGTPGILPRTYLGDLERLIQGELDRGRAEGGDDDSAVADGGILRQAEHVKDQAEAFAHAIGTATNEAVAREAADLVHGVAVALLTRGVGFDRVLEALRQRGALSRGDGK